MALAFLPQQIFEALENLDLTLKVQEVPEIGQLLNDTLLLRGKKIRPTLLFLMGQVFRVPLGKLQPYARAAEWVHAATLAHDDVIDESAIRRSRPTLNAQSSNIRAVLAGDLLFARVMSELSALGNVVLIHGLALTVEALVGGEWLQLNARGVIDVDRDHLELVARKKTASLMSWCCSTAAHLAGLDPQVCLDCAYLGEVLGISFQMADDIIDYCDSGDKPFAQDLKEGLVNFVTLEMLQANSDLRKPVEEILRGEYLQSTWPWQEVELRGACDLVSNLSRSKLQLAEAIFEKIVQTLKDPDCEAIQAMWSTLDYLKARVS